MSLMRTFRFLFNQEWTFRKKVHWRYISSENQNKNNVRYGKIHSKICSFKNQVVISKFIRLFRNGTPNKMRKKCDSIYSYWDWNCIYPVSYYIKNKMIEMVSFRLTTILSNMVNVPDLLEFFSWKWF